MELKAKIIMIITLVLLLVVSFSTYIVLNLQKQRVLESKTTDVDVLGNIIQRAIEDAMASGETAVVQRILENMGKNPELLILRILSPEGHILKSKNPYEIGLKSESFEISGGEIKKHSSIVEANALTHFHPVSNRRECYTCHSELIPVNGIVEVKYDISRSRADILATRRGLILAGIVTVLAGALITSIIINKMVIGPIFSFKSAMKAVERGDMGVRMAALGNDDLELARSFNRMLDEVGSLYDRSIRKEKEMSKVRAELANKALLEDLNSELEYKVMEVQGANQAVLKLSKEVKSKNVELEVMVGRLKRINEIGSVLTSIIDYDELLKLIVKTAAETLSVDYGSIYVMRGRGSKVAILYDRLTGVESSILAPEKINPLYSEILSEGRQVILNGGNSAASPNGKSHIGVPLKMKGQIIGAMLLSKNADAHRFTHDDLELLDTISNQAIVALENSWLYETVKGNYFGTIQSLVNALEASDRYTSGHSERVRVMVLELARYIGIDPRELEILEHAAILHDIGKIGIDSRLLNKEGVLTASEFSLIKAHPIIGDEILGPIGTLKGVRTTILQHHERYDGKGYPYGISGEEITLKARLLAVTDTFDAMVSDRPYRKALSFDLVIDEMKRGSGSQFDPVILGAFLEMVRERDYLLQEAGYSFV